jgi:uncharacterized membrane protein
MQVWSRWRVLAVALILLGSAVLAATRINASGFWYDEMVSIGFITDSAEWYQRSPEQMPGYYLLLRGWVNMVGLSELAGRWLALLLGLLTLAATYRLAAATASPQVGLVAVLALGSATLFTRYLAEMRPYTMLRFEGRATPRHRRGSILVALSTSAR